MLYNIIIDYLTIQITYGVLIVLNTLGIEILKTVGHDIWSICSVEYE